MELPGNSRTADGKKCGLEDEWPQIECFRCGICCERHQTGVSLKEMTTIAGNLGLTRDDFVSKYVVKANIKEGYLLQRSDEGCVFLRFTGGDKRASCIIHPVRPQACREWVASLSRSECREGLTRIKAAGRLIKSAAGRKWW